MSKIFDLINELCPDGVEFMEVEEVFIMKNGYTPSKANKDFWENGTIPWYRMEDIRENGRILSETIQKITPKAVKGGKLIPKNSIIVATTATIGEHALAIADSFLMNQRFTSFTIRELLKDKLDIKFVFYYFFKICEWCKQNTNSSSFPSVDMAKLKKVKFPVPPMEVQREIVRIMDSFTSLTEELMAKLTEELTARKKQYEFYRDFLLSFDELDKNGGCEIKMLGEMILNVSNIKWSNNDKIYNYIDLTSVDMQNHQIGNLSNISKEKHPSRAQQIVKFNDIIFATTRPMQKRIAMIPKYLDGQICSTGYCVLRVDEKIALSSWVYYVLCTSIFYDYVDKFQQGASYPSISDNNVKKFKIPVPSLQTQQKVVDILDKFDTLVNSITEGLPREIELRRKQYEHYRELLLNFKPKMTA